MGINHDLAEWQSVRDERPASDNIHKWSRPGEVLEGTLKDVAQVTSQYGANKLYSLTLASNASTSFYGTKILNGMLEEARIGYKVKIVFLGEVKGQNGAYKNFAVEIKPTKPVAEEIVK